MPVQNFTALEVGGGLVLAIFLVDKIIAWIGKLRGKGGSDKKCLDDPRMCASMAASVSNMNSLEVVEKAHDKMEKQLEGQTLVLDRIYQGQALQIKALDRIVERLDKGHR